MEIIFNPFYDTQLSPELKTGEVLFDSKTVGESGLLDEMMLRMGCGFKSHPMSERIASFVETMNEDNTPYVWRKSFEIDPTGVARAVIRWRDSLVMDFDLEDLKGISSRLDDIIAISQHILPGSSDAWLFVRDSLAKGKKCPFTVNDTIILTAGKEFLSRVVLDVLSLCGATVKTRSLTPADRQDIRLIEVKNLTDAYEFAATEDICKNAIVINSDNRRLNSVLRRHRKRTTGSKIEAGTPAPIHAFKMGLALLGRRTNIHVLLAYLQSPGCPVFSSARRSLANALVFDGGFGENWSHTMDNLSDAEKESVQKYLMPLLDETIQSDKRIDIAIVKDYLEVLQKWAISKALHAQENDQQAFYHLGNCCKALVAYLEKAGSSITFEHLDNMTHGICEGIEIITEKAQIDCLNTVKSPLSLVSEPDTLIWLDCCGEGTLAYKYDFLSTIETNGINAVLKAKGLEEITSREQYARASQSAVSAAIASAKNLVVFSPAYDMNSLQPVHPVVTDLKMRGIVPEKYEVARYCGLQSGFKGKLELTMDGVDLLGNYRGTESQSSIEDLIDYPFDFLTDRILKMASNSALQLADIKITKGNVAHLFVEKLVGDCNKSLDKMKELFNTEFDKRLESAVKQKGLVLNLKENRNELIVFSKKLKESVGTLIDILEENKLTPVECESPFPKDFCLEDPIGAFKGYVDFITWDKDGNIVIIDFKWSEGSFYTKKLTSNTSIQLELYRKAVEKRDKKTVTAVGYYMFPQNTLFTCSQYLKGAHVKTIDMHSDRASVDLYQSILDSVGVRKEQFKNGKVEMAEQMNISDAEYSQIDGLVPLPQDGGCKTSPFPDGVGITSHQILKDILK